jgi:hypothetical protein
VVPRFPRWLKSPPAVTTTFYGRGSSSPVRTSLLDALRRAKMFRMGPGPFPMSKRVSLGFLTALASMYRGGQRQTNSPPGSRTPPLARQRLSAVGACTLGVQPLGRYLAEEKGPLTTPYVDSHPKEKAGGSTQREPPASIFLLYLCVATCFLWSLVRSFSSGCAGRLPSGKPQYVHFL